MGFTGEPIDEIVGSERDVRMLLMARTRWRSRSTVRAPILAILVFGHAINDFDEGRLVNFDR